MTARHRMVDGVKVDLTAAENTARDAEDTAWLARPPAKDPLTVGELFKVLKGKGVIADDDLAVNVEVPK